MEGIICVCVCVWILWLVVHVVLFHANDPPRPVPWSVPQLWEQVLDVGIFPAAQAGQMAKFLQQLSEKRPHEKNSDCPQIRKFRILKSVSFHRIHRYPSNFHRYPSRFQQSLIWSACLFEICDREFQRGDYGNLDNLPWNRPHMTSKIAPSVCLLADFPTIYSFISAQHRGWRPKQQPLWAWVTLNQKSVLMKKYAIHTSMDFVCQFEKDWSSGSNLRLSWKTLKQNS